MADAHMKGKLIKKKGQEYVEIKDTVVKLTVKAAKAHFGNLFNGDPTLSTCIHEFHFFVDFIGYHKLIFSPILYLQVKPRMNF